MNLFRKQKFSIRKFNIGIFSALIATVAFLAHPGQATASELEPSQNNDTTAQSDGGLENTSQSNPISEKPQIHYLGKQYLHLLKISKHKMFLIITLNQLQ